MKEKQVTPLVADKPPGTPGTPDAGKAVPCKAPAAATDFSAGPAQVNQQMATAQVTEEQLAKSNEPEFTGALKQKKEGEKHAQTAPGQVRSAEAKTLAGARAAAGAAGAAAMTALATGRKQAGAQVGAGKEEAKSADEARRAKVTAILQKVFDATKKDVEAILSGLGKKVDEAFSKGEKAARDAFTAEHKRRMGEYKDKRYSGLVGKGRWLKDKFAGLPEEANQIFVQARQGYVARMQQVISTVADVIGAELGRAKQRIAAGRNELQAEVKKLPADLRAIGKQAAGEFAGRFDELTEQVNNKGTELVQTLAARYTEALKSVDEQIAAEKEKNKGLIAKAVDAIGGVIKTIMQLKDMLMGVLAKAAQAVMAIIKDPIKFLGNLVSAVGAGLKAFLANIGEHLKKGLVGWLTGAMAGAGLQLPARFDLRGIVMMLGSLLGLTWAAIRGRIVRKGVPEQAMGAVEQSVPLVQKVQSEGLGGMWEEIKDKVGDLKTNLFSKISEYLIPTVLMAGITWIISLLNPASAFIRAVKGIIDFVTFIVTQGAQIIEFVNSVLDAIIAIATGGKAGVPALIEKALARSVPVLIGALAAILGIGGIAQKVKKFFQALSKPVMKAVDWVVSKIVKLGEVIWVRLKGRGKSKETGARPSRNATGKNEAAIREAEAVLAARPTASAAKAKIGALTRHRGVSLRVVVESQTPTTERVHVQTMTTGSHDLPKGDGEESEEVKLLNDGRTSVQDRQKLLADVRAVVQNELVIGTILQVMRDGQIKKANRVGILQKLVAFGEKDGYRLTVKERNVGGRPTLQMEYYGVFREQTIKVGNVRPGGTRPVGEAWVEPRSIGDGETPVPALAMDFLVDPSIERAGLKGLGSRMFTIASSHYQTQYRAVAGEWYTLTGYASKAANRPAMSKNLVDYLDARKRGLSPADAVRKTWTYDRVKKLYGGGELDVRVWELPDLDFDNPPSDEKIVECLMRPR